MTTCIDVAKFTPPEPLTAEQQSYIHGGVTAPWQEEAYLWHWDNYPQHRAHYLRAYKFFRGYNIKHKAATNLKRLAGAVPEPAPEQSSKARHC